MSPGGDVHHAHHAHGPGNGPRTSARRRPRAALSARPSAGTGPFPGVVVVHDAYGMTAGLRRVCDHLAAQGYVVQEPSMHQRGRCLRQTFRSLIADRAPPATGSSPSVRRSRACPTARCGGLTWVRDRPPRVCVPRGLTDLADADVGARSEGWVARVGGLVRGCVDRRRVGRYGSWFGCLVGAG
ncbi:dienelactone hydrolase family protein [Promicromonospora panici]|uniref:dienelactone hydrolase family protein n=1 Tax=Promicromonospora panici TaxID=2219658 RepID=UPI003BF50ED1